MKQLFTIYDYTYDKRGDVVVENGTLSDVVAFVNELLYESPDWHFLGDPSELADIVDTLSSLNYEVVLGGVRL